MKVFSAKWIVPMDGTAIIEDGEVVIEGDTIAEVRPVQTPANERRDLGNAALLPGLINSHSHLEYTVLRGLLEDVSFFPWIRALTAAKATLDDEDWITSAKLGALECLSSGITTIADNTDSGAALDAALSAGLRGRIYQEFFCIDQRTSVDCVVGALVDKLNNLNQRKNERLHVGISPHATYTINPAMFKAIGGDPRLCGLPISIHVAESPDETSLIRDGSGEFAAMFKRRDIDWSPAGVSPTRYVYDLGVLRPGTLLIHGVQQNEDDIALLARSGAAVIHCPKSNAKLGAGIAPLAHWLRIDGLKIGIGTDSAVSNNSHDLFEEMRFALLLQRARCSAVDIITAFDVLQLATMRGADALGMSDLVGSLTPGKKADLIAVDLTGLHLTSISDPIKTIVYSARASDVTITVINGEVCYDCGNFPHIDAAEIRRSAKVIMDKISAVRS